jgi:small basic protein
MIGIAALVVGIVLGLVFHPSVPEVIQPYLPIAVVAALDAVFGGLRAYLERIFDPKVFVVSFVFNVLVAGTQLSTAIIVVLGIRIFGNAAALRRRLFGA